MAKLVCLANSFKESGRCIAGIDMETSKWIRPVSKQPGGMLSTTSVSDIKILDILEITLAGDAPDEGCQPENHLVCGPWKKIGRMNPENLLKYCEDDQVILHNSEKSIPIEYFKNLPKNKWKSLQLIHQTNATFQYTDWPERRKFAACLRFGKHRLLYLPITDPEIRRKLNHEEEISKNCIITVSLATPWEKDNKCYKVVAGVVELL